MVENSPRVLFLSAYSPHTAKYSPYKLKYFRRLRRRLCINKITLKSPLSPCKLIVFWRRYWRRLNTFGIFSDYDKALLAYSRTTHKKLRISWNKFALLIIPGNFKGIVYQKKLNGPLYIGLERKTYKFYFSIILKKICSLRIWRIRQMVKKVLKLRISWLIIEHHEHILDSLFLP